jgi:hypothetical protein
VRETEESPLLETLARKRLVETVTVSTTNPLVTSFCLIPNYRNKDMLYEVENYSKVSKFQLFGRHQTIK